MLDEYNFQFKYRSDQDSLFNDFYLPCLENSIKYDRAAGYFTSNSLKLMARGLEVFLYKKGKIRIVANPALSSDDMEAIEKGYIAKESAIERSLLKELKLSYENIENETLNVISWLIYNEQLDIKIAYLENNGIYHEKFGIFYDEEGNSVSFSGSMNETYSGLTSNFEKIDVYTSNREKFRVQDSITDFEKLWNNQTSNLKVIDLPESIRKQLIEKRSKVYPNSEKKKITLREYQEKAIAEWNRANHFGIFEMATGTGKTYTSLIAAEKFLEKSGRLCTVIIVPFQHLVNQWSEDVNEILGENIIKCFGAKKDWLSESEELIQDYNLELVDNFTIITTYATAQTNHFKSLIQNIAGNAMLIADECHKLTYKGFNNFPFEVFQGKMGLSATPDRWWDDDGTEFIKKSLGEVVFEYNLKEAISNSMLTEYKYYPSVIDLEDDEMYEFNKYTTQIIKFLNNDNEDTQEILGNLFRKRASIITKAKNKLPYFLEQIKKENISELTHTLVYCAEGQTNEITQELNKLGLRVSKFNSDLPRNDRTKILDMFEKEDIQVLVAMKCLDEGVDIPSTKKAYFLASTSNPREFVQRRGRILRKYKNKSFAEVYDYITLPLGGTYEELKSVATKELPRFAEFCDGAINSVEARNKINKYLKDDNLGLLLYKKPWEIYQEYQERLS